jgi:hypothetical protein
MSFFDDLFNRIFPANKKVGVQEILKRSPGFIQDYRNWLNGDQILTLKHDLSKSWGHQSNNVRSPVEMSVYTSDYANGFVVHPMYLDSVIPLSFLMEYLKDQMINISYRLVHADRRITDKRDYIEILEKYHLKPPLSYESLVDQMYGNIHIELLRHDKTDIRLKFLATIYSDRKFTRAKDFNDLISFLFDN